MFSSSDLGAWFGDVDTGYLPVIGRKPFWRFFLVSHSMTVFLIIRFLLQYVLHMRFFLCLFDVYSPISICEEVVLSPATSYDTLLVRVDLYGWDGLCWFG